MSRIACFLVVVAGFSSLAASIVAAPAPKPTTRPTPSPACSQDNCDDIEDLMDEVHNTKDSPWTRSLAAVAKNPPDWNTLSASMGPFEEMSQALKKSGFKDIIEGSGGYIKSVADLAAATKAKDAAGARKAMEAMKKSCADCHSKNGVGGELKN